VNKMDLVEGSQARFDAIVEDYRAFAEQIGLTDVTAIPTCARTGGNVSSADDLMPWYSGPDLMTHLRTVHLAEAAPGPMRMTVQNVSRPNADFRGFAGRIVAGSACQGDAVRILPSGVSARIERIVTMDGDLVEACAGQSVTLTLTPDVDVSRGNLIAAAGAPPEVADQFEAHLVWMSERPLLPGRSYWLKLGAETVGARISDLKHKVNVDTGEMLAAPTLALNDIGLCTLALDAPVAFEPYAVNRDLGGFILIDRMTNETAGAGMIRFALRRAANIHPQALTVSRTDRAALKRQSPLVLWFPGLSGGGQSTIAHRVRRGLVGEGLHSVMLDGDNVRHGLNRDLGFTDADRVENIRRVAEVARLMTDAGLIVLVSFISPFREERRMARERMEPGEFLEVFIDVPLEVAEARDVKGLYAKARAGQLSHFTGIDSPYEAPEAPDLRIDAAACSIDDAADQIVALVHAAQTARRLT